MRCTAQELICVNGEAAQDLRPMVRIRVSVVPREGNVVIGQLRNPRANMPRYAAQFVSDQDVADIYAYLSSVPAGPKAGDIALLRD